LKKYRAYLIMHRGIFLKVNFGGFVDISTVDWPGKAACTVFLRGCPLRCSYCHNLPIQTGEDYRDEEEILAMVRSAMPLAHGVVFSGGEPTAQGEALRSLARSVKALGLPVGLQTNGFYPEVLEDLIGEHLIDRVAIDYKTRWEGYSKRVCGYKEIEKQNYEKNVRRSITLCKYAKRFGDLAEFDIVLTLFHGNEEEVREIAPLATGLDLVLQQGVLRGRQGIWVRAGGNGDGPTTVLPAREAVPLTLAEFKALADQLGRRVRIRTREGGEVVYEGHRSRGAAGQR
jgi:pyruvate formate lyase activating enzyme